MTRRSDTKDRILDKAEALLQERGFNAFSYHDISRELGIKNAAVHYHFPSKADLGTAVIERYRAQFGAWVETHRVKASDPRTRLNGYFAIPLNFVRNGGKVCPLGVLEAEFTAIPESMRAATRLVDEEIRTFLAKTLEEGREAGQFRFDGPAEDKALVITAALQGALQIARAAGAKAFFATIRQLQRDLGA